MDADRWVLRIANALVEQWPLSADTARGTAKVAFEEIRADVEALEEVAQVAQAARMATSSKLPNTSTALGVALGRLDDIRSGADASA